MDVTSKSAELLESALCMSRELVKTDALQLSDSCHTSCMLLMTRMVFFFLLFILELNRRGNLLLSLYGKERLDSYVSLL